MNGGKIGSAFPPSAPRPATLNDRLTSLVDRLNTHCDRIEVVVARVNGVPSAAAGGAECAKQSQSLVSNVDALDAVLGRIANLADAVERIA